MLLLIWLIWLQKAHSEFLLTGICVCLLLLDPGLKNILSGINFRIGCIDKCLFFLAWFNLVGINILLQVCYLGSNFIEPYHKQHPE